MSDYGYRPAPPPPPEDGRAQGQGQQGGRAYGSAAGNGGPGQPDYGWGGGQQQGGGHGSPPPPPRAPRPQQQPYGTPASGSASVGRASGSASVGRGSASVGGASGSASVGSASVGGQGRTGRASVGSASVGSASVGSASVGSASVGAAKVGTARPGDERTGRAGAGGRRRAGSGPLNEGDLDENKKAKKKKRRKKVLAGLIAVGVLFVAGITIVASYFFVEAPPLEGLSRAGESSTFYYSDGETAAGGYGETLRLQAADNEIPDTVKNALVATEDRKFYEHSGVDYVGTMRALINNVTGGSTQGASTITQQYAGMVMAIRDDISYDRKAREAATAMKLESTYTKDQIISAYLNLAWFGRGATGVEAAAEVYFNKKLDELTPGEAAYIVMQVKSPDGTYDPYYGEGNGDVYDEQATQERWDYSMQAMVDEGYLSQADKDAAELPVPTSTFNSAGSWGGNSDVGFIVNEQDGYVFDELLERYGIKKEDVYGGEDGKGGYQVTLTIDQDIQAALKSTGSRGQLAVETNEAGEMLDADGKVVTNRDDAALDKNDEGYIYFENTNDDAALKDYEKYMTTAMVAIDPESGSVLAYYGGDDGFGVDKAGEESPHPPSSTFKMITAATAIENGDSIDSWFNASSPRAFDTLKNEDTETCIGSGDYPNCTLKNGSQNSKTEMTLTNALRESKNTPMYAIAQHYGADKILATAEDMGLEFMSQARQAYDDTGKVWDVKVDYQLAGDSYTQHGQAKDAEGNWILDSLGNIRLDTPLQLDNCNPVVNTEGIFLADPEGVTDVNYKGEECAIGGKGGTDPFYNHLAFGQYPTSVASMAAMYATIANDGEHWPTHFIASVKDNAGNEVEPESSILESTQPIDSTTAQDLQWVGSEISGEDSTGLEFDRNYFGKTGTWEASCEDCESSWNAHAWYVGAIPQLSIAAWVGNATSESDPIADPDDNKSNVFGSNTAYPVWYEAMTRLLDNKSGSDYWDENVEWAGKANAGNPTYWDIEDAGALEGGPFCAAEPENELCAGQSDDQAQEECEAADGTWDGETCQPGEGDDDDDTGTEDPTTEPTDQPTDDECPIWQQDCNEPSGDPTSEGATTSEDPEDG